MLGRLSFAAGAGDWLYENCTINNNTAAIKRFFFMPILVSVT